MDRIWLEKRRPIVTYILGIVFPDAKRRGEVFSPAAASGPQGVYAFGRKLIMAIGNVVQRSAFIYVYDEKGRQLCTLSAGAGSQDGLKGYTSSTVNVRRGAFIYTYDEKGRQISTTPAR